MLAASACGRGVSGGCPALVGETYSRVRHGAVALDLVVVIDSAPTALEQLERLSAALATLSEPYCVTRSNPSGPLHPCDLRDPEEFVVPLVAPDLRVGVVSADLGARGSGIDGCETARGDDGRIGPETTSPLARERRTAAARSTFGVPAADGSCRNLPAFLSYCGTLQGCRTYEGRDEAPTATDALALRAQLACHQRATARGCQFGQPLEAVWRALVEHGAAEPAGSGAPNAGFLRPYAQLAIVVLATSDDHSVRDCAHDHGFSASRGESACREGTSAFDRTATQWASDDVEARFYLAQPNGPQDPTWNLDRYISNDPGPARAWTRDLDSLKPGQPYLISFFAIAGVPIELPQRSDQFGWGIDWAALSSRLEPSRAPECARIAPVCRREGVAPASACQPDAASALPSRRIVEVARRFAQSPRCNGVPCEKGAVLSVCASNFDPLASWLSHRIAVVLTEANGTCLREPLELHAREDGSEQSSCVLREFVEPGTRCDRSRGRSTPSNGVTTVTNPWGGTSSVCEITEIPTLPPSAGALAWRPAEDQAGWYVDRAPDTAPQRWSQSCEQRISFTRGAQPDPRYRLELFCPRAFADRQCPP
ncbi:MAG: hypothetical protein JNK05_08325 [Myxococcales bacterium]|nr:hypothetical protein [Myxococcales bacterium]